MPKTAAMTERVGNHKYAHNNQAKTVITNEATFCTRDCLSGREMMGASARISVFPGLDYPKRHASPSA